MPSQTVINILGIIGGVVLAICQAPQLIKLWRTKSAADLSYAYLILYTIGLLFITVYLYLEKATVGWICESIETACGFALILFKFYYDTYGPLGSRTKRRAEAAVAAASASQKSLLAAELSGHKPPPGSHAGSEKGSDGSEPAAGHVGNGSGAAAPGSTHAAALPAAAGHQLRERRRSHESLAVSV